LERWNAVLEVWGGGKIGNRKSKVENRKAALRMTADVSSDFVGRQVENL
jgi:hypothetical protein